MKSKKKTRSYDMTARAEKAAQTERNILQATAALWQELSIHEITLEAIAERAGVSVRTILRKYGSKEDLFEVCIKTDAAENERRRNLAPAGDVDTALRILLDDYEQYGDANIRTLAIEAELEVARKLLESGRKYHRRWCARVFGPYLPDPADPAYEARLIAFISATDVYLWKLLRRDLKRDREETLETFRLLVTSLIAKFVNN